MKIYITLTTTFTHLYRKIVLKLFDDKCEAKASKILTQSYKQDWCSRSCIFNAAIVTFYEGQNLTLRLTMIFHSPFKMKSQNTKVCLINVCPKVSNRINVILCCRYFPFEEDCYPKTSTFLMSLFYDVTNQFSEWHYQFKR